MKLAFTGDLVFQDIDAYTEAPFRYVADDLSKLNLVINLESVFLPDNHDCEPIKTKVCLSQKECTVNHLASLNPLLINLSNNHVNDYGNFGVENTYRILKENALSYLGAGYESQQHHQYIMKDERIIFLSYTLGTDKKSKKLYNESDLIGPRKYTFNQYQSDVKGFDDYTVVVLFHWGAQPSRYPFPYQREIARELIDDGVDIIIGNHAHIFQGYEKYKGKYVFYSLGNFLLPNFNVEVHGKTYKAYATPEKKHTILPVFDVSESGVELTCVLSLKANKFFELEFKPGLLSLYNQMLLRNMQLYKLFHWSYLKYRRFKIQYDKLAIFFIKRIDGKVRQSNPSNH